MSSLDRCSKIMMIFQVAGGDKTERQWLALRQLSKGLTRHDNHCNYWPGVIVFYLVNSSHWEGTIRIGTVVEYREALPFPSAVISIQIGCLSNSYLSQEGSCHWFQCSVM